MTKDPADSERDRSANLADEALAIAELGAVGLASLVPAGGLLAHLLGKIERNRDRRQRDLLTATHEALETVKGRVDELFTQSDDFEVLIEEVIEKAARRKELDKRDYYAAAVANSAAIGHPDPREIFRMIDTLERLRESHLWLLRSLLYVRADSDDPADFFPSSFEAEFAKVVPESRLRSIKDDWRDLEGHGLAMAFPSISMSGPGARNFRSHVTDLGRRFDQFVTLPYEDVHPPA